MNYENLKTGIEMSLWIFLILIGICLVLYIPRLIAWFSPLKKQEHLKNEKQNHFAILIPARNESKVISGLLDTLVNQSYDRENYDIHIIVKDDKDETIKISKKYKGLIHIVRDQKCKSDALNGCFQEIFKKYGRDFYDAYLIMDADCWMDYHCLEELNNAFASDRQVIQCKKLVKNYYLPGKNIPLQAVCNGLIWTLIDEMGNRFKSDNNITAMTIGTGICFRKDVINKINGWPYNKTLTEDIEFMFDATLRGFTTYYASYAHIYMEEAGTLEMTNIRRNRWMSGVCDSKKYYNRRMADECITIKEKVNRYYCKALWVVYWMFGIATFYGLVNFALGTVLFFMFSDLGIICYRNFIIALGIVYGFLLIMTMFSMIIDHRYIKLNFKNKLILLFTHPIFYMEYIWIVFKALFIRNNDEWKVIERVEETGKKN